MGGIFHSQITIRNAQISTIDIHVYILFNELFNMYIYIYILIQCTLSYAFLVQLLVLGPRTGENTIVESLRLLRRGVTVLRIGFEPVYIYMYIYIYT